jgi:tight adherence protein B
MTISGLTIVIVMLIFGMVLLALQGIFWAVEIFRGQQATELSRRLGTANISAQTDLLVREAKRAETASDVRGKLEDLLLQAGTPFELSTLVSRMAMWGFGSLFIIGFFADLADDSATLPIKLGGVLIISGIFAAIPVIQVQRIADQRTEKFTEQLPEALDLMARSLRAGHGVSDSMRLVSTEMAAPASVEFGRVYEEHNLGVDFRASLEALVARNKKNFDLRIFVSSVLLQRDTGGNLIEILEQISATIRERFVFYGKVRTLTAESRISALILGSIPFFVTMAIVIFRPSYLEPLVNDPWGIALSIAGSIWFTIGVFVLRELTKIEV